MKQERLLIEMSGEKQKELWNGVYFMGSSYEMDGETYTSVDRIKATEYLDGESWYYIVQRKSDGLYFRFHVWDAGEDNGYLFEDEGLEQVFETTKITYE